MRLLRIAMHFLSLLQHALKVVLLYVSQRNAVLTSKSSVGRVILEHVHHVVQGDEGVIDGDHLKRVNNGLTMFALYPATLLYTYT